MPVIPDLPLTQEALAETIVNFIFGWDTDIVEGFVNESFNNRSENIIVRTTPDKLLYSVSQPFHRK